MKLRISFNPYQSNWYVGELYKKFFSVVSAIHDVEYVPMEELAKIHGEPLDYQGTLPSIFNIYNLIIQNKDTEKTFVHSLNDYATVMLEHYSALRKLNVVSFACTSNLTDAFSETYSGEIKILPSFYILENWNDIPKLLATRNREKSISRAYFNGLCYGNRAIYYNILKSNRLINFNNKNDPSEYVSKDLYYNTLADYKFGLSLNGAARICYRDLEYFGGGVLNLREALDVQTIIPLRPDVHFKIILDDDIQSKIHNPGEYKYISDKITSKINDITVDEICYIKSEAATWFDSCATPDAQVKILLDFILKSDIS